MNINQEYFDGKITIPIKYCGYLYQKGKLKFNNYDRNQLRILVDFGGGHDCDNLLIKVLDHLSYRIGVNDTITILFGEYYKTETETLIRQKYYSSSAIRILKKTDWRTACNLPVDIVIGCGGYNVTVDSIFNNIPLIIIPKDVGEEADLHASRIEKYSTAKTLNRLEIDSLWEMILAQVTKSHSHSLSCCNGYLLLEFLNGPQ